MMNPEVISVINDTYAHDAAPMYLLLVTHYDPITKTLCMVGSSLNLMLRLQVNPDTGVFGWNGGFIKITSSLLPLSEEELCYIKGVCAL